MVSETSALTVAPSSGPTKQKADQMRQQFEEQRKKIGEPMDAQGENWVPDNAPSMVPIWACEALAKAGTFSVIGVYPQSHQFFPLGQFMNKNLRMNAGNCNHRRYIPQLLDLVQNGTIDPSDVLTQMEPVTNALDAYKAFDTRQPGWIKVELVPQYQV